MKVSVGVNAKNKNDFLDQLKKAEFFLPVGANLHIDISKKNFSSINSFFDFKILKKYSHRFNLEGHLMLSKKDVLDKKWFLSPLKVLFIHSSISPDWEKIFQLAKKYKKEIGVVIDFDDNPNKIFIPKGAKKLLVLAVIPGKSGQKFHLKTLKIICFLRKKYPSAIISVDGGISPQIIKQLKLKRMGVNGVVSSSYIWDAENPAGQYEDLRRI